MPSPTPFNGIVIVDKPSGMTSHDVVHHARKLFRTRRVGHTGTLDPDATGVLVICLGNATRLAEYLSCARKHYVAEITFGIETDTQDASGQVLATRNACHLRGSDVSGLLPRFRGTMKQIPPMVSAVHHEGRRLYELARAGIEVTRAAREVCIDMLELTAFVPGEQPRATLEVTCSTGTYIRTLAADLGRLVGTGGMLSGLRRSWVGDARRRYTLCEAQTLDALRERERAGTLAEVVLPPSTVVNGWPTARLDAVCEARIRRGQPAQLAELIGDQLFQWETAAEGDLSALLDNKGDLLAIARLIAGQLQPIKVFA